MPRVYTSRLKRLGLAGAFADLYETFVIRRGPDECWGWSGAITDYGCTRQAVRQFLVNWPT